MSGRKRSLLTDMFRQVKRPRVTPAVGQANGFIEGKEGMNGTSNPVKTSLLFFRSLFPVEKFEHRLPPIVMKHQLYSLYSDRELVNKQINEMCESGEVKVFRLGTDEDDYIIVFTEDYRSHAQCAMTEINIPKEVTEKFVHSVIRKCNGLSIARDTLVKDCKVKEEEICHLVKACVLTEKDRNSWWFSLPNSTLFIKSLARGRKTVITMVKKCKYREIFRKDLEQKKWPKLAKLGLLYHIHDVIGANLVDCVQTASGLLMRYKE